MKKELSTFDLLRQLKSDDTLRFGQWLWNLLDDSNDAYSNFEEINIAVGDRLWNIHDDILIKLIEEEENES